MAVRASDCIVIGGGVMGCALALRLAQAGASVLVLEKAIPGAEASSAAAGILAAQEEAREPGPLFELGLASRARFPAFAAELRELVGIDVAYRRTGVLAACVDDAGLVALEARFAWQRAAGQRVVMLSADEARVLEPGLGPRIHAALSFPDDAQLEPRAYARALSLAAARAGVTFVTGAWVTRVLDEGERVAGVLAGGERYLAPSVVVAAGSWSSLVDGAGLAPHAVRPLRGQIVELETRPPAVCGTIVSPRGGYVVGRADGRVLCGSTMEEAGWDKVVTAGGMAHVLDVALELVPGLAAAPVTASWANFRPATLDELPLIGPAALAGLFVATGHFRNGILLSAITAELVRDLVLGRTPAFDLTPFAVGRATAASAHENTGVR